MAKGAAESKDWQCCEKCSYFFTILVGVLFFLAGGAMAVYSALFLWGDIDTTIAGLEVLNTDGIQIGIFVVGVCIAGTALLGMITAGCAKCAANPDGVADCCERCCTAVLSILYIVILSVLLVATLVIAGFLSYYYSVIAGDAVLGGANCPYPSDSSQLFVGTDTEVNSPDPVACPFDYAMYEGFFSVDNFGTSQPWILAQDSSFTCGFYCDSNTREGSEVYYCSPGYVGTEYDVQTTGTFCSTPIPTDATEAEVTKYVGTNLAEADNAFATGAVSTMPFRPTMYQTLANYMIPLLAVWWCIFVFALLLIIAACVMCVRKSNTAKKDARYKPGQNV